MAFVPMTVWEQGMPGIGCESVPGDRGWECVVVPVIYRVLWSHVISVSI